MDRFASMHDEDIDKLGIPNQGGARGGGGEGGWKGRKRARELSQLKDRLDRASEKEQQSWDLLKQAVGKGGGAAADEGRFKATGTNRAAEEMRADSRGVWISRPPPRRRAMSTPHENRPGEEGTAGGGKDGGGAAPGAQGGGTSVPTRKERTVGLVTAEEFRKAREAADSLEEAEAKRRQEEEAAAEEARETARRTAERKKRKSEAKKKRLQKSKMSFALEEDEEEEAESSGNRVGPQRTDPTSLGARKPAGPPGCTAVEKEGGDDRPSILPSGQGITTNRDGCEGGMSESRSFKGAAPDEENSSAAAKLRERLGRDQP